MRYVLLAAVLVGCGGAGSSPPPPPAPVNWTPAPSQGVVTTMRWSLENDCASASVIQVRYFDVTRRLFWPADPNQVLTVEHGAPMGITLNCTSGDTVCFGAANADDSIFWGMDVNGSKSCAKCCAICGNGDVTTIPLECN